VRSGSLKKLDSNSRYPVMDTSEKVSEMSYSSVPERPQPSYLLRLLPENSANGVPLAPNGSPGTSATKFAAGLKFDM
jgi:hypothetical protein